MKINFFNLIIEIITILSIIFALAVITSTNPVIAVIFLIGVFLTVAIYLILMGLNFIGLSYLLVYIGAITVLILFIVMMISTDILQTVEVGTNYSKLLPLAYSIAILFLLLFLITIPSFIIDFSSFEIYNLINKIILTVFSKENYNLNFIDNSIFSLQNIQFYLNKLGLGFLLSDNNVNNNALIISDNLSNSNYNNYINNNGPFYYQPLFNRDVFVEYNPSTYSLIGSGKNPTGFYY
jgi:NADH-ubiquinone oxidoreductase chain 6